MNKNNLENIKYLIRCVNYSTSLPIWLFKNDKYVLSFPEVIKTAESILKNQDKLAPNIQDSDSNANIIQNEFNELYILIKPNNDEYTIMVGPLLNNKIEQGELTNMVRNGLIPFHSKSIMQDYFKKLNVLDDEKIFYTCKLLENLFNSNKVINKEINIKNINFDNYIIDLNNTNIIHPPYEIEKEISDTISNGNIDKAKVLLKEINLIPHANLAKNKLRSYKNSMICSCTFMSRASINGGVNPNKAFSISDYFINQIEDSDSISELEFIETKMVEVFTQEVLNEKNKKYSKQVLKAINYINNHLCDKLNNKIIAKEVYLNPSYLSDIFHKETGFTLSNWIIKERINEAKKFVNNSNEDIAEIAFMYQFCNQSYFAQCFKKHTGYTPGEYRKINNNEII